MYFYIRDLTPAFGGQFLPAIYGLGHWLFHQNNGIFPKRRRDTFHMLKDDEIKVLQSIFQDVFRLEK
jgi:hypothetical protein